MSLIESQSASRRTVWIALGLIVASVVIAHFRPLLLGDTFILRDHLTFALPSRGFLADSLASGNLPEWWDGIGMGVPFAANPLHGVLYPPMWLTAVLPMPFAIDFVSILHLMFGGIGTFFVAQRLGADRIGAAAAGIVFATSGYAGSTVSTGVIILAWAWLPWIIFACDRLAHSTSRRTQMRSAALVSAAIGAQLLAGDPVAAIDSGLIAFAWTAIRADKGSRLRSVAWFAAAALFALMLAAALVVPSVLLLSSTERGAGFDSELGALWSMHPMRMLELIWPDALGDTATPSKNLAMLIANTGSKGMGSGWALSVYVGIPTLFFATAAAISGRARSRALLGVSLFLVLIALGSFTPFYDAYRLLFLPESFVRYPEKHLGGAVFLWATLAGLGLTWSFAMARSRVLAMSAIVTGALATLAITIHLLRDRMHAAYADAAADGQFSFDVDGAVDDAVAGVMIPVAVAAGITLALFLRRRVTTNVPICVAAAVVCLPLVLHTWSIQPVADRGLLSRPPLFATAVHAELENREYAPRLYRPRELRPNSKPDPSEMMLAQYNSLIENSGTLHGFAYMPGFDPALSYQLRIVWDESVERKAGRQMLDLFAVEYAVFSSRQAHRLPMERKASADGLSLVHNRQARPRAFVSNRWSWVSDQYAAVDHLFRPGRDPREVVLVGTAPAGEIASVEPPTLKPCALVFDTPERVVVTCQSEVPAVAVLLDSYAKGWTATVDGDAREIYRAEVLTRGILLESGEHEIVFSYRTPGLRAGLLVSMLAWLGLAAMLISSRRRRPR